MTRILFFIAVAGSAMPVYAMDCKREWVQACVGSDQDKTANGSRRRCTRLNSRSRL